MADAQKIVVTRVELAAVFGKNSRLIRAFELMLRMINTELPGDTELVLELATNAKNQADGIALGSFGKRNPVPMSIRRADGITITPDGAGMVIGLDTAYVVGAMRAYLPRPQIIPPQRSINDASAVLANRGFGNRLPVPTRPTPTTDAQGILAARAFNRR